MRRAAEGEARSDRAVQLTRLGPRHAPYSPVPAVWLHPHWAQLSASLLSVALTPPPPSPAPEAPTPPSTPPRAP